MSIGIDKDFFEDCLATWTKVQRPNIATSASSASTESTAESFVERPDLTVRYPNAYADFYGSGTPCVFKTGSAWYRRKGPDAQSIIREARPIYRHPIGPVWLSIGKKIWQTLDSNGVRWTSINPLAYADAGKAKPFCPFVISIGVQPHSLPYEAAVGAAKNVQKILADAGFPTIEVAFVESVVTRSGATGPKLLSFDPILDDALELRKPFTSTLGLSLATLQYPHYEGTGALYYRLDSNDKRLAVLTCAHVARPPPVYPNISMTMKTNSNNTGQRREEIISLGNAGYINAVGAIMGNIGTLGRSIVIWKGVISRMGDPVRGEHSKITERRKEHLELIEKAEKRIKVVNELHTEVTKRQTFAERRVIGFVLHSEEIAVSVEPHSFTKDWALIELYDSKIDWASFKGNQVYIGGNLSEERFVEMMFPQLSDRANYSYPADGLLQAYGVVPATEFYDPQHRDIDNEKCLLVVKNGSTTGTTIGRVNGLQSFTRKYDDYGISHTSIEIAVCSYGKSKEKSQFSDAGDSGSIVLARDGRIVGIVTGGSGTTTETDITYLTPYWWVEQQVKAKFPGCFLYDIVHTAATALPPRQRWHTLKRALGKVGINK